MYLLHSASLVPLPSSTDFEMTLWGPVHFGVHFDGALRCAPRASLQAGPVVGPSGGPQVFGRRVEDALET